MAVAVLALAAALLPDTGVMLEFDHDAILAGEVWRAVTGQLLHWSEPHLTLNLAGAALLAVWFRDLPTRFWITAGTCAALAVALGLLLEAWPLASYRGLSGVLYGWLVAGLLVHAQLGGPGPRRRLHGAVALAISMWALIDGLGLTGSLRAAGPYPPVHGAAHVYGILGACVAMAVPIRFNRTDSALSPADRG